eukprot:497682-Karenia_brevis.AAC.1
MRLPPRMYGGGIRSLDLPLPAAFVATVCRTLPCMIDSYTTLGERRTGFMPHLVSVFGAGSFDNAPEAR